MKTSELLHWIADYLSQHPELLKAKYRRAQDRHPMAGHCYVASEALFHLRPDLELHPVTMRVGDAVHWWLVDDQGNEFDVTREQFRDTVSEFKGTRRGFLTKKPSRRAQQVIDAFRREHPGQYEVWARAYLILALEEENRVIEESIQKDFAELEEIVSRIESVDSNAPIMH